MATTTTTTAKAPTKRENFMAIREILAAQGATDLVSAIDHELELLDKRANKPRKSEEAISADNALVEEILATLSAGNPMTVSEMQKHNANLSVNNGVSCSKITSLLTNVILPSGQVKREVIKRKAYYSIA